MLVDTQRQFLPSLVLSLCFDYKYRIGYSSKCFFSDWKFEEPNRPKVHDTYQSLMLARRLGIRPLSPLHSIKIPEWVEGEVEALFRNIDSNKMIAMFPLVSFNDPCRQWPVNYWMRLTELLSNEGYEVILLGILEGLISWRKSKAEIGQRFLEPFERKTKRIRNIFLHSCFEKGFMCDRA